MQKRWLWIVTGIACAAAVTALWQPGKQTAPEPVPQAATPLPAAPAAITATPAPIAVATQVPAPAPNVPRDPWLPSHGLRDHLVAATAGDVDAMLRVGRALRACVKHVADPSATKLRAEQQRMMDSLRARAASSGGDGALMHWKNNHAQQLATHADCMAIGAEQVGTGLHWIERAARAGNPKAKLEYARDAFSEFPDANALLANLDEVARRRDLARAWAMQALEAGERGAVDVLVRAYYGESPLFPRNFQRGAPYSMAQEMIMARFSSPDEFRRLYDRGPERERYAWGDQNAWVHDDVAWQAAIARARAIVDLLPPDPRRE